MPFYDIIIGHGLLREEDFHGLGSLIKYTYIFLEKLEDVGQCI